MRDAAQMQRHVPFEFAKPGAPPEGLRTKMRTNLKAGA